MSKFTKIDLENITPLADIHLRLQRMSIDFKMIVVTTLGIRDYQYYKVLSGEIQITDLEHKKIIIIGLGEVKKIIDHILQTYGSDFG